MAGKHGTHAHQQHHVGSKDGPHTVLMYHRGLGVTCCCITGAWGLAAVCQWPAYGAAVSQGPGGYGLLCVSGNACASGCPRVPPSRCLRHDNTAKGIRHHHMESILHWESGSVEEAALSKSRLQPYLVASSQRFPSHVP